MELDKRNPTTQKGTRVKRHHQHLSEEHGLPTLRSQIWQVIALLKTSMGRRKFDSAYARLMGNSWQPDLFED